MSSCSSCYIRADRDMKVPLQRIRHQPRPSRPVNGRGRGPLWHGHRSDRRRGRTSQQHGGHVHSRATRPPRRVPARLSGMRENSEKEHPEREGVSGSLEKTFEREIKSAVCARIAIEESFREIVLSETIVVAIYVRLTWIFRIQHAR